MPAGEIGAAVKATLYRVVQEALMNVHRHAGMAGVCVLAKLAHDDLKVEVIDDGPGFDMHEAQMSTNRLGLHGLRERVEALGGAVELVSSPGCETRLHATLPYTRAL